MTILWRVLRGAGILIAGFVLGRSLALAPDLAAHPAGRPATPVTENSAPRRLEATVYLPTVDNQGRPFEEARWQHALESLVAPFGGATLGQPQEGCWLDGRGRVCREPIRPVVVSFAPARLAEFRKAVHDVGKRLGQEAMYVRFEEPRVDVIPVAAPGPERER
jgi:hypothetical protein